MPWHPRHCLCLSEALMHFFCRLKSEPSFADQRDSFACFAFVQIAQLVTHCFHGAPFWHRSSLYEACQNSMTVLFLEQVICLSYESDSQEHYYTDHEDRSSFLVATESVAMSKPNSRQCCCVIFLTQVFWLLYIDVSCASHSWVLQNTDREDDSSALWAFESVVFSKVNSTSPCCARSELDVKTSHTRPAWGAVTGYSIFMASKTTRFCPSWTSSPDLTNTSHTLAVKVAVTSVASLGASVPDLPSCFLPCSNAQLLLTCWKSTSKHKHDHCTHRESSLE